MKSSKQSTDEIVYPFGPQESKGVYEGIEWFTHTNRGLGCTNGYVRVPEELRNNPLFEKAETNSDFSVHGGITYGMDREGWIGFDTAHYTDYTIYTPHGHQWTVEEVEEECKCLAEQVAQLLKESKEQSK